MHGYFVDSNGIEHLGTYIDLNKTKYKNRNKKDKEKKKLKSEHEKDVCLEKVKKKRGRKKDKERQRFKSEFKKIRPSILLRDNYMCVECGSTKELHVHHKIKRSISKDNSPENLETLCKHCHKEKHKGEPVYLIM